MVGDKVGRKYGRRTERPNHSVGIIAVLFVLLVVGWTGPAAAQTATVRGFVTDASDGRALAGATVALYHPSVDPDAAPPIYGAITNTDGVYLISRIAPGNYQLRISFIGFEAYRDTLILGAYDVRSISVALELDIEEFEELVVEEEREGISGVDAGHQTIRPEQIDRLPSPDISADLATYLTTLPGIVTTGDQGGQFFVRGGEPSQNLVFLDGMHVYQPFHLLGYYSVFPTDILNRVDFYAGGYPSRYGTRMSSVIDVSTRKGNNRRFEAMVNLSPFTGSARLEGPLIPGRFSFLVTGRESLIEEGASQYVGQDLPFQFGDAYAKIHGRLTPAHEISLMALRTHESGTIGEATGGRTPDEIYRKNEAVGMRALFLPRFFPVVASGYLSHSRLTSYMGAPGDPSRTSSIKSTRIALDASFPGRNVDVHAGWEAIFTYLNSDLGGLFQNVASQDRLTVPGSFYGDWDFRLREDLHVQAGARLQFFNVRIDPYVEPRIRASWERGRHRLSAAAGVYQQELVGISDRRDAANVFTVWTRIARDAGPTSVIRFADPESFGTSRLVFLENVLANRIGRAWHGILGYRFTPTSWLDLSVEGFYKEISNLFVAEWTALPGLTASLHPATGRAGGLETRVELSRGPFYAYLNYGLSSTLYRTKAPAAEVWFGTDGISFHPPHDRRHQIDALMSVVLYGFEFSARWAFGSGLPFTRPRGYDGFAPIDDVHDVFDLTRSRRVLYEHPFRGRMPAYHRLDVSLQRSFEFAGGSFTLHGSVLNVYDRRNVFYYDTFTLERVDQLPIIPSFGVKLDVE